MVDGDAALDLIELFGDESMFNPAATSIETKAEAPSNEKESESEPDRESEDERESNKSTIGARSFFSYVRHRGRKRCTI